MTEEKKNIEAKEQKSNTEKISEEIKEEVKEEIKKDIPSSPETKSEKSKEKAAEKVAEEVVEETEKVSEKIAGKEDKPEKKNDESKESQPAGKDGGAVTKVNEKKTDEKKKKKDEKLIPKKDEAVAFGRNLHMSKKHGVYICRFIKNKKVDDALKDLEDVRKMKKAVPFRGEIPHRRGKGMMSGRYPINAAELFISMLKSLKGNVIVNGMDLERARIVMASANWARRPMRSDRRQGKRTHVVLRVREISGGKK
jgi:ribosomal protein L22